MAILGLALAALLLREIGVLRFTLPEKRRLVPETVFVLGRHLGPLQFGLEMGTGVRTYLPTGLPYAAAVAVLLFASVPAAVCAGAGFGLGRAMMTISALRYGSDGSWSDEWSTHRRTIASMLTFAVVVALLAVTRTALPA
jgi:hypothetical protein